MPERRPRSPSAVSREHSGHVLARERRDLARLRRELGGGVVDKLDRFLARDLIHERRQRALDEVFGVVAGASSEPREVMVHLRGTAPSEHPVRRDHPELRRRVAASALQRSSRLATERLVDTLAGRQAEVLEALWLLPSVHVSLSDEVLEDVAARADVLNVTAVKHRFMITLNDSRPKIRASQVQGNLGFDGTGVTVAILDTGVDAAHVAFGGGTVAVQQDFTGEGIGDMHGHGTHCAGIVASRDRKFRGIAPGASIVDLKHMDANGSGTEPNALLAIQAAVNAGVPIASNSWGASHANGAWLDPPVAGQPDGTCSFCRAADAATAAGVLFVVAAGNEDNDTCSTYDTHIGCPGLAATALTVGGSDDNDGMYTDSSIGPTPDGRAKPDIVAPGVDIISARASGTSMGSPVDGTWTQASGTSMATPHVAGVAALMLQKVPGTTPANLKALIVGTAVDIGFTPEEMGAGRVDALDAVTAI